MPRTPRSDASPTSCPHPVRADEMDDHGRMTRTAKVLRAYDPAGRELGAEGWQVTAMSWAARMDAPRVDRTRLENLVAEAAAIGGLRELGPADADAVLALDDATLDDYPGGPASAHLALTRELATVGPNRRAFGVERRGELIAMTFVVVDGSRAETEFTVVSRPWRGHGLATAVKAASVLALLDDGVTTMRTGGSAENLASLAANRRLGYVIDEVWLTWEPPDTAQSGPRPDFSI